MVQKLEQLPEQLRAEVEGFIDFLFTRMQKPKKSESQIAKWYGSWKGQIEMQALRVGEDEEKRLIQEQERNSEAALVPGLRQDVQRVQQQRDAAGEV